MLELRALTLKQLRALDAVAEYGTMTQAADSLGLTTPAIHNQLKILSQNLGSDVLERTPTGRFRLTKEAEILRLSHQKAQTAFQRAILDIDALRRGVAGSVSLGVVSTAKYFAPGIVAELNRLHPEIEIQLVVGNRQEVIEGLESEALDLAIMGRPPRQPMVDARTLGDHPHILACSTGDPLAGQTKPSLDELFSRKIILREPGSGTRILAHRFLDQLGRGRTYTTIEMESNETIKQSVMAGLGIALLSAHTLIEELHAGRIALIPLRNLPIIRQWFLLHRQDLRMTGAIEKIRADILADAARMIRLEDVKAALGTV